MILKALTSSFLLLICGALPIFSQRNSVVGDLRFHKLQSKVFGNTRTIRVLVPPGYGRNKSQRYPVLYLNDGQNLFQVSTAQFSNMEWGVDETLKDLQNAREVAPVIVVGIDNAGKRKRSNEYLPWEDIYLSPPLPNPQGIKYPEFLTAEVIPFIEKRYRVKKGVRFRGLGGSSYGALISLYTVIEKPKMFGAVLLESPSFYVSDAKILEEVKRVESFPGRFYMGVGTNEEGKKNCVPGDLSHEAVQDVLKLKSILLDGRIDEKNLKVVIEECATHSEAAYGRRLAEALTFLFPRK